MSTTPMMFCWFYFNLILEVIVNRKEALYRQKNHTSLTRANATAKSATIVSAEINV